MYWLRHSTAAVLCLGSVLATPAMAHDLKLKEKARELGISVGNNYVCTAADKRAIARAKSEAMYDMILFGVDHEHAYVYAVAVGYGAAMDKKNIDCKKLAARLAEVRSKMGLGGTE